MKTLEFTELLFILKSPFKQLAVIIDGGQVISSWPGRTTPNIQRPGHADDANLNEYPVVAGGIYPGQFLLQGHRGSIPAIVLNDNGPIPGFAMENPRFPEQDRYITHVHVHEASGESWPGSAACPTLVIGGTEWMKRNFQDGELLRVIIPGIQPGFLFEDVQDKGGI